MSIRTRFSALGISAFARMNMMPNPFVSFTSATSTCATDCTKLSNGKCACYTKDGDTISCTCPDITKKYNYDWDLYAKGKKRKPKADPCAAVCNPRTGSDAACAACMSRGLYQPQALYGTGGGLPRVSLFGRR